MSTTANRLPHTDYRNHSAVRETIMLQTPTVFDLLTIVNFCCLTSIKKLLKEKLFPASYCASHEGEADMNNGACAVKGLRAVRNREMCSKSALMHAHRTHRYLILITGINRSLILAISQ